MTKQVNKWVLAVACAATALAAPQIARAQDSAGGGEENKDAKPPEAAASGSLSLEGATGEAHAPGEDRHAEEEHEEEAETKLAIGVDMVIGFGKTPVVTQQLPGMLATVPENSVAPGRITTESFLLGGSYEVAKHIGVGARVPFTFGSFTAPGQTSRGTTAVGNVELEGEYELHMNHNMKLIFALGAALPTAQGDEVPTQEDLDKQKGLVQNQNALDRFAVNHAAASSRGFENNALFEPKRFGLIPLVALDYKVSHILIDPYVKMENLISTSGNPEHSFIGELVFGTFLGYEVMKQLDVGTKIWANVLFAGESGTVAVLEPQLRFHFGNVTPIVGGIIPFAGDALTNPQFGGVRVAVAARF